MGVLRVIRVAKPNPTAIIDELEEGLLLVGILRVIRVVKPNPMAIIDELF